MTSQTETVEKPAATKEFKKAPAVKKAKKAVKTAPTGEKTLSYQEMVKQVRWDLFSLFLLKSSSEIFYPFRGFMTPL